MKLSRIWHPVFDWEELLTPMWESCGDSDIDQIVEFTGNHVLYGSAMERVVNEWPISCENSLTNYNINRKAWLGHAACALQIGAPQSLTRKAWALLNDEQRTLANREASRYIGLWERRYIKDKCLYENMAEPLLL
jgi:hypothetical protein